MRHPRPAGRFDDGARRALAGLSLLVVLLVGTSIWPWQRAVATSSAPAPVRVAKASVGPLQASLSLSGELRPTDQLDVATRVGARVTQVAAGVGQAVQAGQTLAELDRTALEIALLQAQSGLAKEKAALAKLQSGARSEDVAKEEAALRAAEARLEQVKRGPKAEDIDSAVQKLNQARDSRSRVASQLSLAKEQARITLEQALLSLQSAQGAYGAAKLVYDEAVRTNKDPNIAPPARGSGKKDDQRDLTDVKLRQYKAAFEAAENNLRNAEQLVENRRLAYEDAKQQEIAGLRIEAAKIQDSQAGLDKARSGPDADAVAKAEADIEAARANLAKVMAPTGDPELQTALAAIRSAEAAVRLAEINLAETRIVAPFAGIVTQRFVSPGSIVSAGAAIVQLVSQTIEVRLNADDSQIATLAAGQQAELRLNAFPGVVFNAKVESISPSANAASRTFTVTLIPEKLDPRLKPGMLAQAEVAAINRSDVLTIPEQAVMTRATETTVFVVESGKARRKVVVLGIRGNGMIEILSGLQAGEAVIIDGLTALNDNDQVAVSG